MAQVNPYLNFKGNCLEAMNFYKDCFDGKLAVQTVGQSPFAEKMGPHPKDAVLHSSLASKNITLMGSDIYWGEFSNGNAYHLSLDCESEKEINNLFSKLGDGGQVTQPLGLMPWGAMYGSLVDKFGKSWFFNYSKG